MVTDSRQQTDLSIDSGTAHQHESSGGLLNGKDNGIEDLGA